MTTLQMKRIHCIEEDASELLRRLVGQLTSHAEVISEKGRQLTEKVFGEALPPTRVVERICHDVRERGQKALLHFTKQFDQVDLEAAALRVRPEELADAYNAMEPEFLQTVQRVRQNILAFQFGLMKQDAVLSMIGQYELRVRYRPMRRVGVCIPGGAAAYPSTLLMTVCPAQAAGVKEIAVVMPPTPMGAYNTDMLATCHALGITEVYRVGGAQAVAALAYGVDGMPAVDMIVGPGNIFVTLAKKFVYGQVAIDCLAGPSEIVVVADDTASAKFVAADLIAQAEHDPATSILITWHEPLLDAVENELQRQLKELSRAEAARNSLQQYGALVLTTNAKEAIALVNQLGPEHLHIQTQQAEALAKQIDNAGAIFVGDYSPVALGDYAAGPSHVLPTGSTARFASGLSATDFLTRSSVLSFTKSGMTDLADDVCALANKEGLTAHAASVRVRLDEANHAANRNDNGR